ncbi:hypothetical protein ACFY0R_10000 [Streptomyces sp. NPDC001633]|uniref:hypothetical protein n=1 Tax=Streptomyces sp. NPDC001633 TaxID=3364595 RepID=UPI0036A6D2CB
MDPAFWENHIEDEYEHCRLTGYAAADQSTANEFETFWMQRDACLRSVHAHHTNDGLDSYLILADSAAMFASRPGADALITVHITRDPTDHTFRQDLATQPSVVFAQRWLIDRGCPVEAIRLPEDHQATRPADALTAELEEQLLTEPTDRYEELDTHTQHEGEQTVTVLVRDADPLSSDRPFRIFHQVSDYFDSRTHTLREGAWADAEAARRWISYRTGPIPQPRAIRPATTAATPPASPPRFSGPRR